MNRIENDINESIPIQQDGFRRGRNFCDQVLAFSTLIEAGFQRNLKTNVSLVDHLSAYDIIYSGRENGLVCKLQSIVIC